MICSGKLIKKTREKYDIPSSILARGLCRNSYLNKIENGEREAGKLLFEALCQRMGMYSGRYEELLDLDEYEQYITRKHIYIKIDEGELTEARELLNDYAQKNTDNLSQQLICFVDCEIMHKMGEPKEVCMEKLLEAISYTYKNFMINKIDKLYLSRVEMHIVEQYVRYMELSGNVDKAVELYEMIIEKLEQPYYDQSERCILYVPVGYWLMNIYIDREDYKKAVEVGEKTFEMVKEARCMSFFLEIYEGLVQSRKKLNDMEEKSIGKVGRNVDKKRLIKLLEEKKKSEQEYGNACNNIEIIKRMHSMYGVPEAQNFFPRYMEDRAYNVNEIIKQRRIHLGMTREELAEDICETGSICRYENNKVTIQRNIREKLLQKVNMSGDKYIATVDTYDAKVNDMVNDIGKASEEGKFEKAAQLCENLFTVIDMSSTNNRQFVGYKKIVNMVMWNGRFDMYEEQICNLIFESMGKFTERDLKDYILLNNEWCLMELLFLTYKYSKQYDKSIRYLREILSTYDGEPKKNVHMYFAVLYRLADMLGESGEIDEANECVKKMIGVAVEEDYMVYIPNITYLYAWNVYENKKQLNIADKMQSKEMLNWCAALAEVFENIGYKKLIKGLLERHEKSAYWRL